MKIIFLAAGCLVMSAVSVSAQKIKSSVVPAPVMSAFEKMYPGKTAVWEKEKGNFEAGLKADGTVLSLLFSAKGELLETETALAVKDLPAKILAYVHKNYPGAAVKEGAKIVKQDGSLTYEAEVKGRDLIFDPAGEFLNVAAD